MMNKRPAHTQGFTILEIMIAIGILAFGSVAVLGLFTAAVRQSREAVDHAKITLLADVALADSQRRLNDVNDTLSEEWTEDPNYPAFEYKIKFTASGLPGEYKVKVTIGWGKEKSPQSTENRFTHQKDLFTVLLKE